MRLVNKIGVYARSLDHGFIQSLDVIDQTTKCYHGDVSISRLNDSFFMDKTSIEPYIFIYTKACDEALKVQGICDLLDPNQKEPKLPSKDIVFGSRYDQGRSFFLTYLVRRLRTIPNRKAVLISDSKLVDENPKLLLLELVYSMANDDEKDANHAEFLQKIVALCGRLDSTNDDNEKGPIVQEALKAASEYCNKIGSFFVIALDQNEAQSNDKRYLQAHEMSSAANVLIVNKPPYIEAKTGSLYVEFQQEFSNNAILSMYLQNLGETAKERIQNHPK